ncbi:Na+/H+ antiporter NhaA [Micrococcales bacterium 31B]|nr:Na+/H+ antiporter NhaA [Micrococcales bacterium 31B]
MTSHSAPPGHEHLLHDASPGALRNFVDTMRGERFGGILLLLGAVGALVWVNSPWGASYESAGAWVPFDFAPSALHIDLTMRQWALDGLLVFFFFVVGLELKREFVVGELRDPRRAMLPIIAALGGMAVPALVYTGVQWAHGSDALRGWAIPTATDIAFAVAVLAVVGKFLPAPLRIFLLTLAVVDDLLGISIIAIFYTANVNLFYLAGALLTIALFGLVCRHAARTGRVQAALVPLVLLAVAAWWLMHASGVHATIAGVLLGLVVPAAEDADGHSVAERFEHFWRPFSAAVCVPVFAVFAAGVALSGDALAAAASDPAAQGVFLGLVLGKPLGILLATWIVVRWTASELDPALSWLDILGVGLLAGVGFTVSLFIGELAFAAESPHVAAVKAAVVAASVVAALVSGTVLALRSRVHERRAPDAAVAG